VEIGYVHAQVEAIGWCVMPPGAMSELRLDDRVKCVAEQFGRLVPGRGKKLVEPVIPKSSTSAYSQSLSSKYGLNALPLHTDTAYWSRPCRYLVIACAADGHPATPTILFDSRMVSLSISESTACRTSTFKVSNGRNSFYGCIAAPDRPYTAAPAGRCVAGACARRQ
jgi:hypothetical protein